MGRSFLMMADQTPLLPSMSAEPEIERANPSSIIAPSLNRLDKENNAEETTSPLHVEMDLGLGVFNVNGQLDALLQRGVAVGAGCLPSEDVEDLPLVQELPEVGTPEGGT